MRVSPVLLTQLWGIFCGGALGALRTGEATAHLLAKNRLLAAAGLPHLPGAGHWQVLESTVPAWAGAVFFGLSLGLGTASLGAVWCQLAGSLPGRAGRGAPWLLVALPAAGLAAGDAGLAACLATIAAGALLAHRGAARPRALGWQVVLVAVCAGGLVPWALAEEGPFTRLRDQVLFGTSPGRAVDDFYYRWTLYPAEVLKPLTAKTQVVAAPSQAIPETTRLTWCRQARQRFGVLCAGGGATVPGVDLALAAEDDGLMLAAGAVRQPWPAKPPEQVGAWQAFSRRRDDQRALRRATGLALFLGCPAGLCWLLASAALAVAARVPRPDTRPWAAAALAAGFATLLAAGGLPDPEVAALRAGLSERPPGSAEELARHLRSPRVVERFYAARAAPRLGPEAEAPLLGALGDPVINVRYAAAQALGRVGGAAAREALAELLDQPEEWYVKERAYASLRRLGWSGH